jgi:hypothetical protein
LSNVTSTRERSPDWAGTGLRLMRSFTPASELGSARTISTSTMSPIAASVIRWTDCSQGDLPMQLPGQLAARSSSTVQVRPKVAALNAAWSRLIAACSRWRRSSITSAGIAPSISAAGVPGRGLYLKLNAWA